MLGYVISESFLAFLDFIFAIALFIVFDGCLDCSAPFNKFPHSYNDPVLNLQTATNTRIIFEHHSYILYFLMDEPNCYMAQWELHQFIKYFILLKC